MPRLLTASRETVAIGPKRLWTDIGAIEAPANGSAIADLLDEAEWPPLSDLDDITPELDEWLQTERSRLSTLIMQRAADAGEGSDPGEGRRIADALERIDPLDERVAQIGLRADIAVGDRASAHRRVERLERRLKDELRPGAIADNPALLNETPTVQPSFGLARPPQFEPAAAAG